MRYAVIFTRNDGWSGCTTIECIKDTYEEALSLAESTMADILKKNKVKGSVQDNIKKGVVEFGEEDFIDDRIKANFVFTKGKTEVLVQEIE